MTRTDEVKVWDPVVRIGHWLLVALFAAAYITGEADSGLHAYSGYGVLGIVSFRLLWGFVGTRYARFAQFLRGPRETLHYLKSLAAGRPRHYLGHNPAGGWMIVLLLSMLSITTWTGLETYGAQGYGPLAKSVVPAAATREITSGPQKVKRRRTANERFWKNLHEVFANATLLLILLHVAGAVVSSVLHRENLVKAMFTGAKRMPPGN